MAKEKLMNILKFLFGDTRKEQRTRLSGFLKWVLIAFILGFCVEFKISGNLKESYFKWMPLIDTFNVNVNKDIK